MNTDCKTYLLWKLGIISQCIKNIKIYDLGKINQTKL